MVGYAIPHSEPVSSSEEAEAERLADNGRLLSVKTAKFLFLDLNCPSCNRRTEFEIDCEAISSKGDHYTCTECKPPRTFHYNTIHEYNPDLEVITNEG